MYFIYKLILERIRSRGNNARKLENRHLEMQLLCWNTNSVGAFAAICKQLFRQFLSLFVVNLHRFLQVIYICIFSLTNLPLYSSKCLSLLTDFEQFWCQSGDVLPFVTLITVNIAYFPIRSVLRPRMGIPAGEFPRLAWIIQSLFLATCRKCTRLW